MGALTSNRKRGDDYFTLNLRNPASNSPTFDTHISKKPRLSLSLNQTTDKPNPIKSSFLRLIRYPDLKSRFTREPHAPIRLPRFGLSVNLKNSRSKFSSGGMGNLLSMQYERKKRIARETCRYTKDDEVIEADDQEEVSEDLNTEEVEILEHRTDLRWKDSDVDMMDQMKFDEKLVSGDFRTSSSSVVTSASNENLKVKTTEKLLDSLSLSEDLESESGEMEHKKLLNSAERRNKRLNSLHLEIKLKESQLRAQQSLYSHRKEKPSDKEVVAEAFKPLTEEEEAEVSHALSNSNRRKLLVFHENSNIEITGEVLQCLKPRAWLNDEVINLYLELLKEREKREPQKFLKCHFFNTFFYKKLISGKGGYNFQSVRRWTFQRKLGYCVFDCDKIFVPIHKEVHWCLAVIDKRDEKFQYLDSLGGVDTHVLKILARYIMDEVKDKSGNDIDVSSWKQEYVEDLPEQENGFDCGMFMIKYADFYSRDIGLCFKQENMPYFRRRTAKEILKLTAE